LLHILKCNFNLRFGGLNLHCTQWSGCCSSFIGIFDRIESKVDLVRIT
jgi:hypothetical protein